jgi:hypothetical protein
MTKNIPIKEIIAGLGFVTGAVTFVYGLGLKNANKENHNAQLENKVDAIGGQVNLLMKNDSLKTMQFEEFMRLLNDNIADSKRQKSDFMTLEKSYVNTLTFINRLDEVIRYYENKQEAEKPEFKIKITQ